MNIRLIPDWKAVLKHSWTLRLIVVAALLSGAEVSLPLIQGYLPVMPGTFAILSGLTTAAAFVARLVAQAHLSGGRNETPVE